MQRVDSTKSFSVDMKSHIRKENSSANSLSIFFRGSRQEKDSSSNDEGPGGLYEETEAGYIPALHADGINNKLRRGLYNFYNKLKRHILWRFSLRGAALFLIIIYIVLRVLVPMIYEPAEDFSFLVPDELVAEGNEPYGLNFRCCIHSHTCPAYM